MKWTTKDGAKIAIREMTDRHLINAMRMLERAAEAQLLDMPYPTFQGDMAQYQAESDFDSLMCASSADLAYKWFPVYKHLQAETRRRTGGQT